MAEGRPDTEAYPANEKAAVTMHEKAGGSVDHKSDPESATKDPLWKHGIDEKHEKRILLKLDLHLLPFVSLLYLLSFL
jgi:hypothetical protein